MPFPMKNYCIYKVLQNEDATLSMIKDKVESIDFLTLSNIAHPYSNPTLVRVIQTSNPIRPDMLL